MLPGELSGNLSIQQSDNGNSSDFAGTRSYAQSPLGKIRYKTFVFASQTSPRVFTFWGAVLSPMFCDLPSLRRLWCSSFLCCFQSHLVSRPWDPGSLVSKNQNSSTTMPMLPSEKCLWDTAVTDSYYCSFLKGLRTVTLTAGVSITLGSPSTTSDPKVISHTLREWPLTVPPNSQKFNLLWRLLNQEKSKYLK